VDIGLKDMILLVLPNNLVPNLLVVFV